MDATLRANLKGYGCSVMKESVDTQNTGSAAEVENSPIGEVDNSIDEEIEEEARPRPHRETTLYYARDHIAPRGEYLQHSLVLINAEIPRLHAFLHRILFVYSYSWRATQTITNQHLRGCQPLPLDVQLYNGKRVHRGGFGVFLSLLVTESLTALI